MEMSKPLLKRSRRNPSWILRNTSSIHAESMSEYRKTANTRKAKSSIPKRTKMAIMRVKLKRNPSSFEKEKRRKLSVSKWENKESRRKIRINFKRIKAALMKQWNLRTGKPMRSRTSNPLQLTPVTSLSR